MEEKIKKQPALIQLTEKEMSELPNIAEDHDYGISNGITTEDLKRFLDNKNK